MKRVVFAFFSLIFLLLLIGYLLLFTKGGNSVIKPFIRDIIKEKYSSDLHLLEFQLTPKTLQASLEYGKNLDLKVFGDFVLWNQKLDLRIFGKSRGIKNAFSIEGEVTGNFSNFLLKLSSNIASSKTSLVAELSKDDLFRLYLQSKNLNLEDMFLFFNFDHFLVGKANLEINLDKRLKDKGDFKIDFMDLMTVNNFSSIVFFNRLLKSRASGTFEGKLGDNNLFIINGKLKSNLYDFVIDEAYLGINSFRGKYNFMVASVKNAGVISRRDYPVVLEGNFAINNQWDIDFQTQSLGGNVFGKYEAEKLNIIFEQTELDSIFPILGLPQSFLGSFTGELNYKEQEGTGVLQGNIQDFLVRRDKFFDLVYRYTKFDIQKEKFDTFSFYATLKNQKLDIQELNAKSRYIHINSPSMSFDFQRMVVNLPMRVGIQDSFINLKVSGDVRSPQVDFKLGDILKLNRKLF